MAEQLTFDLPARQALGRDDFFVSQSNSIAVGILDNWRNWPEPRLLLIGETGSGKSHLAHVWAQDTGARILTVDQVETADIGSMDQTPMVIEDVDRAAGWTSGEKALFHIYNIMVAGDHPFLMTARSAPSLWQNTLPDLASRMQAMPLARLDMPDDRLLGAVMLKLFEDRQLRIKPGLLPYLLPRLERSFAAAQDIVERLDQAALKSNRAITRALAAAVLDKPEVDDA